MSQIICTNIRLFDYFAQTTIQALEWHAICAFLRMMVHYWIWVRTHLFTHQSSLRIAANDETVGYYVQQYNYGGQSARHAMTKDLVLMAVMRPCTIFPMSTNRQRSSTEQYDQPHNI